MGVIPSFGISELASLLHCFQASDHCLNTGPYLLVLLQERRALRCKGILALFQRMILVLQLVADLNQSINSLLQSFQFVLKFCICFVGHGCNIELPRNRINRSSDSGIGLHGQRGHYVGSFRPDQGHILKMGSMDQAIDHDELNDLLRSCGSNWHAGQAHGLLCGHLSVGGADGATRWFGQVLEGADPGHASRDQCEALLDALCAITWRQLVDRQSDFTMLLPHDDDPIAQRTAAMGLWCEGFLHGLVSEKHSDALKERLAAEPLEDVIKDMLQITRAAADDDDAESDESAYFELVEYLRIATQLTYEELAKFREPDDDSFPADDESLH